LHRTTNSLVPEREKFTVMVPPRCRAALYIVALAYCSNLVASNAPEPEPWVSPLGQVASTCKANHSLGLEFEFEPPRVDAEVNVNPQCFPFGSSGSPFGTEHRERELSAMASFAAPAKPGTRITCGGLTMGEKISPMSRHTTPLSATTCRLLIPEFVASSLPISNATFRWCSPLMVILPPPGELHGNG